MFKRLFNKTSHKEVCEECRSTYGYEKCPHCHRGTKCKNDECQYCKHCQESMKHICGRCGNEDKILCPICRKYELCGNERCEYCSTCKRSMKDVCRECNYEGKDKCPVCYTYEKCKSCDYCSHCDEYIEEE